MNVIDKSIFCKAIPEAEQDISRLNFLNEEEKDIHISVFGKYNHGKSTLLNTIIGKEVFKTSDKRETTVNQSYSHDHVVWVDTPGLDADVTGKDDNEARKGAFTTADVLFLVHNIKTGELDKYEVDYYRSLLTQNKNYSNRMYLVLAQADQVTPEQLDQVVAVVKKQLPEIPTYVVSATRYTKGVLENKLPLVERSGMNELFKLVTKLTNEIQDSRKIEISSLKQKIQDMLKIKRDLILKELHTAKEKVALKQQQFSTDVNSYMTKVKDKI